ncbi:MAG: hypothetical protein V3V03_03580 [Hyphomonadaceae bacterium]
MKTAITALACLLALAGTATADEVWSTPIGDVIYQTEIEKGAIAVLSYPLDGETEIVGLAYIYGLAGVYEGRGAYSGIWIEGESVPVDEDEESDGMNEVEVETYCETSIVNPENGTASRNWGRLELIFTEPDFPSGWVAIRGDCFNDPDEYLIGKPIVGGE